MKTEKIKAKLDSECPECHYTSIWNGMFSDEEYDYYTCKKCGTEWRILREDYKNRRSSQKENFLLILIPIISVITLLLVFGVSN